VIHLPEHLKLSLQTCFVAQGHHQLKAPCNQDDYQLCDTYPAALVVPAETGHDQLRRVAAFRKRGAGREVAWTERNKYAS